MKQSFLMWVVTMPREPFMMITVPHEGEVFRFSWQDGMCTHLFVEHLKHASRSFRVGEFLEAFPKWAKIQLQQVTDT
jgi:hypothetical protein